jgi:hypothetical protein
MTVLLIVLLITAPQPPNRGDAVRHNFQTSLGAIRGQQKSTRLFPALTRNKTSGLNYRLRTCNYCTVTATPADGMPFATTSKVLAPVSIPVGTSKLVETALALVATAMVLGLWVRA